MTPDIKEANALVAEIAKLSKNNPNATAELEKQRQRLNALLASFGQTTQKNAVNIAQELVPPPPLASEVEERKKAQAAINDFANDSETTTVYDKVSKAKLIAGLRERINNPEAVKQNALNLCGPAAYAVMWAKHDPEGYAKAVIELYEKGQYTYNGKKIKANKATFEQELFTSKNGVEMNTVDWMLLPAIRHSENMIFLNYDPANDGGLSGMTMPWEMAAWVGNIVGVEQNKDNSPTVAKVNAALDANQTVVTLVDWGQLSKNLSKKGAKNDSKPESWINALTGNHYVIIEAKIVDMPNDQIKIGVWTWGRSNYYAPVIDKDRFDEAFKCIYVVTDTD